MQNLYLLWMIIYILPVLSRLNECASDRCFCRRDETIDDCTCRVDTVDQFNNMKIYPRLNSLLQKDFFRFYKVNLKRPCPFWTGDSKCALKDCSVSLCPSEQVPPGIKGSHVPHAGHNKYSEKAQKESDCEDEDHELSALDNTISEESLAEFKKWSKHDDALDNFCEMDDFSSSNIEYVDLTLNPERFTGYKGYSAHRVWKSIYKENCFKPQPGYNNIMTSQALLSLCLEKRAFFRVISGLHASINIHLCAKYYHIVSGIWGHNVKEFQRRFDAETTKGEGPQRLKNLYFTYLMVLRAIVKAEAYFDAETFFTGNAEEDEDTLTAAKEIINVAKSFPDHFEEAKMFQGEHKEAKELKEEFRLHFRNISRIMDCVGCDKCRLWGKLQIQGLGTAMKILFSGDLGLSPVLGVKSKSKFQLQRQEIVALFNAFGRLSSSIAELDTFRNLIR